MDLSDHDEESSEGSSSNQIYKFKSIDGHVSYTNPNFFLVLPYAKFSPNRSEPTARRVRRPASSSQRGEFRQRRQYPRRDSEKSQRKVELQWRQKSKPSRGRKRWQTPSQQAQKVLVGSHPADRNAEFERTPLQPELFTWRGKRRRDDSHLKADFADWDSKQLDFLRWRVVGAANFFV